MNLIKKYNIRFSFNYALAGLAAALFIIVASVNSAFLSPDYLIGVMLRNIVEIGMIALPVTLIIITGGIDLSVGSILVVSAMLGGIVAKASGNSFLGALTTIAVGALCGLVNGVILAKLKISPLVTTLATMFLFMGIARGISTGDSVYSYSLAEFMGTKTILGIPFQIYIYAIFAVIMTVVLHRSTLGRKLYAIGLNENAVKFSGVNTDRIKIGIYVLSGIVCAIAALIWLGRFTSIKYDAGTSLNLKVVTVIVLGGTSILGGYGDMKGTIIATLIVAILNSGLTVMNIPIDMQTIVNGIVLVISLVVYSIINQKAVSRRIINPDIHHEQVEEINRENPGENKA